MVQYVNDELKVSRVLHAGYIFECGETRIIFDPILQNPFSHNCYAFPDVHFDQKKIADLHFDAIFISHFHDDHCCFESLNKLKKDTPVYMFCVHPEMFSLLSQLGFKYVHSLELDVTVTINEFVITPRRALDADVDCLFQIAAAGYNVLNVVDSWIDDETLDLLVNDSQWDLILWPFQTMREIEVLSPARAKAPPTNLPDEWLNQLKILNPKVLVPSSCQFQQESWSWYNKVFFPISYRQFADELHVKLPQIQVVRLNPSCSIVLKNEKIFAAVSLDWMTSTNDQNSDYNFDPHFLPPSTADIAMRFTALSLMQRQEVVRYCTNDISVRFQQLHETESPFFKTSRVWELNIFDHKGQREQYYYRICRNKMELLPAANESPSWRTEVSAAKIYSALHYGECLTSMYMRINDVIFSPEIEMQLADVELTEDPLVRCLFEGKFGAYQQAQLKHIQTSQGISL